VQFTETHTLTHMYMTIHVNFNLITHPMTMQCLSAT